MRFLPACFNTTGRACAGLALLAALLASAGCGRAFQGVANPAEIDTSQYSHVFHAAIAVLRDHGFAIDRQDYRFGKVTTVPRVASAVLEPWYSDNTTAYQVLQSTLNYQRRFITIHLEPKAVPAGSASPAQSPGPTYLLWAEVMVEQLDDPSRYLTGSYWGTRLWEDLRQEPEEYDERGIKGAYWEPVGRDPYLEQRLITDILRRSTTIDLPMPGATQTKSGS